ncbi:MAG: thioester reductase domain-containing protein [Cyanobacteria bacterium J06581_3]
MMTFTLQSRLRPLDVSGFSQIDIEKVQSLLRADSAIQSAVVRVKETHVNQYELVAFLVPTPTAYASFCLEDFKSRIKEKVSSEYLPYGYVVMPSLPLAADGTVDDQSLMALPVVTPGLNAQLQSLLQELPHVESAAALWKMSPPKEKGIHLLDLLPTELQAISASQVSTVSKAAANAVAVDLQRLPAIATGDELLIPTDAPQTLTEALLRTAKAYPTRGIQYIEADGSQRKQSYEDLLTQAQRILSGLRQAGLKAGDRVILQTRSFSDHFPTFWACLLGGIIPITIAVAPTYDENNPVARKLFNIWSTLNHVPVIASEALVEPLQYLESCLSMKGLSVLSIAQLRQNNPAVELHTTHPEDVVFIQLSSGSTGIPKCIQITHQGVIAHIHSSAQFNSYKSEDISLNWLPLDHVVPMLTYHLKDVYLGCEQIEVATSVVISNPLKWLSLMSEHRVTHSWSPNFGFKLVSDALNATNKTPDKTSQPHWDLSGIKLLMNAGEQVTRTVVDGFLKRVAPFGVPSQVIQPAFGMAELCTCMTYQNDYAVDDWGYRVAKSSLRSRLMEVDDSYKSATDFVHLGPPAPGVEMRIVDAANALLEEGMIGRLQIRGAVVTPGYLNNPKANAEAFVGEGWFNTGDLGFLLNRHLVITGREKEIIIVNGANFYCYEIEDVVNAISGVRSTYTAAVSHYNEATGSEGLVIFFVPVQGKLAENVDLIKSIKTQVTATLGMSPTHVIPLSKARFPKTTSGKIQRMGLKRALLEGEFSEVIKEIDIHLDNNTLPSWFYRPIWQQSELANAPLKGITSAQTVVFSDSLGLGQQFCDELARRGQPYIRVIPGRRFSYRDSRYTINPRRPADYERLFAALVARGFCVTQIVHLWTYQPPTPISSVVDLERAQVWGALSLLSLLQSLSTHCSQHPVSLQVVSTCTQPVSDTDVLAVEHAPMAGLLKSAVQEMPWLNYRHLDFDGAASAPADGDLSVPPVGLSVFADCDRLLQEIERTTEDSAIAYREGRRWVQKLEKVDFTQCPAQQLPFEFGGFYVVSGGLGGVGLKISTYLLEHYKARLLILGRTPLPTETPLSEHSPELSPLAAGRLAAYKQLSAIGDVCYRALDITDENQLRQATQTAAEQWHCALKGVFHLAGVFKECPLIEETQESFLQTLRPKMGGSWALHQLVKDNPTAVFVNFSSVNGFFGGQSVPAYAAANAFVEQFSYSQRSVLRSYCYAWSMWNEVGMSNGYQLKALTRTKGFHLIEPEQGLTSLWAGLSHAQPQLMIGLDGRNPNISRTVSHKAQAHQALVAYVSTTHHNVQSVTSIQAAVRQLALVDGFGTSVTPQLKVLEAFPLTENGEVDRAALQAMSADSEAFVAPQTPLEESLAKIWCTLLNVSRVSRHDNFFEIGGNSLLTAQLVLQIEETMKATVTLLELFEAPTIATLADVIAGTATAVAETIDFESEAILSADIYPTAPFVFTATPKAVLLTGATGFLGGSLLATLIQETDAKIFCLVRANSVESAIVRIRQNLESQELWHSEMTARIVPLLGDLSQPRLGLSDADFLTLTHEVDVVYHNGAWVNFTYPYSALKQTNVVATEEVLRIASLVKVKPVHFVSTISTCFSDAYKGRVVDENESLRSPVGLPMGYAQGKWVSEKMMMAAKERGMPICIYRPGRIMGHSATGYSNTHDLICRMLKQVVQMGYAPDLVGSVDMTPVDFVSQALVKISLQEASFGKVFHLINPELVSWQDIFRTIQLLGYSLETMSCDRWREKLFAIAKSDVDQALHPLLELFSQKIPFEEQDPRYSCENTLKSLSSVPLPFPRQAQNSLATYFRYFERTDYI